RWGGKRGCPVAAVPQDPANRRIVRSWVLLRFRCPKCMKAAGTRICTLGYISEICRNAPAPVDYCRASHKKQESSVGGNAMILEKKIAVVYGAGGAIGAAVAQAFAREGAVVHLAGRTLDKLERVRESIEKNGGRADCAVVDAFDA